MSKRRWILIGGVVAVVGLVVVLLVTRPWLALIDVRVDDALPPVVEKVEDAPTDEGSSATPAPVPVELASGTFISHEQETSGSVRIIQNADGSRVLAIENLATTNGPDVRVWLSASDVVEGTDGWFVAGSADYLDLGSIKGNLGNQVYEIPADADLSQYRSVSLWCAQFSVSFGAAQIS
ncbi:MAG: DM13 domain-containing protein [Rhodoglobus sp.]